MTDLLRNSFLLINNNPFDHAIFVWAMNDVSPASKCVIARNELEAYDLLVDVKLRPSLIIADCVFPGFDAVRFLKKIKTIKSTATLPFIIHCDPSDDHEEVMHSGAHAFYPKAYTPAGVRNLLLLYLSTNISPILPN
jgi:response regulator RpfG family c-di-GMP phosphodiesterase